MSLSAHSGFALITVMVFLSLIGFAFLLINEQTSELGASVAATEDEAALSYVMQSALVHANWELERKGCSSYDNINSNFGSANYQIDFSTANGSPLDLAITGQLDSGRSLSSTKTNFSSYGSSTLSELVVTKAAYIDEAKTSQNKGSDAQLRVTGNPGHDHRTLIQADLSDLPSKARIDRAELLLEASNTANANEPVLIQSLSQSWKEDEVTWQEREENRNWMVPGGTTSGAVFASFEDADSQILVDITTLVREWHQGSDNNGMLLSYASNDKPDVTYRSDEDSAVILRIYHSCECGEACSVDNQISCDANFRPNTLRAQSVSSNDKHTGIANITANAQVMGVTFPLGGGFITSDGKDLRAFDTASNTLGTCDIGFSDDISGLTYVTGGEHAGRLAVVIKRKPTELYFVGASCASAANETVSSSTIDDASALSYLALADGVAYQDHFLVADKSGVIDIISPQYEVVESITPNLPIDDVFGMAHIPNQERFLLANDKDQQVYIVALDGSVEQRYDTSRFGINKSGGMTINLETCDHVFGDLDTNTNTQIYKIPLSKQPIAHWPLDETSGFVLTDVVGEHHAQAEDISGIQSQQGVVQTSVALAPPYALEVDDAPSLRMQSAVSVAAWINPGSLSAEHVVMQKGPDAKPNYRLSVSDGQLRLTYDNGIIQSISVPAAISTNSWQHIAFSYSTTSNRLSLYLDGALIHSGAAGGELITGFENLFIGRATSGDHFTGRMDDVYLFDSEITTNDVALLFAEAIGTDLTNPPTPPSGASPSTCTGISYADNFETKGFSGSTGTQSWASDWIEVGESDGPTAGDERAQAYVDNDFMRIRDNNNGGEGIERSFDLRGFASATLNFDYARLSLGANNYISVRIDQAGSETEIARVEQVNGVGTDSTANFITSSYDLGPYLNAASNTTLKFVTDPNMPNDSGMYLDNVSIAGCPR